MSIMPQPVPDGALMNDNKKLCEHRRNRGFPSSGSAVNFYNTDSKCSIYLVATGQG